MKKYSFSKVCGAGNDFIVIDNRNKAFEIDSDTIRYVCDRRRSIGADGVMLVEPSATHDFTMRIINADGSEAEMCGNGARCIAWFAYVNNIAKEHMKIETLAGTIEAKVLRDEFVELKMSQPEDCRLSYQIELKDGKKEVSSINTGVPHVVMVVDDVAREDVVTLGREIRNHSEYKPAGTNVNFISFVADDKVAIRTYERGVEDETLACGTGSVAAGLISYLLGKTKDKVTIQTKENDLLEIAFKKEGDMFKNVTLGGPAKITYTGQVEL